jgi:colanic acid/amylovoran biosynthesis glycosyltransferase
MPSSKGIKLAYLVSRYPAVSHTFIQREVEALRSAGFDIYTSSINEPDIPSGQYLDSHKQEVAQTFYVKKQGIFGAITGSLKTLIINPLGFIKGFVYALTLGKADLAKMLYNIFYFMEAILIGLWMKKFEITHLHVHFANPASTVALILKKIYPVTFSMTVHGPDEFYDVSLNYLQEKIAQASFIFCISSYARSQLMRLSSAEMWTKFDVVRLGVDSDVYDPVPFREHPDVYEILCVGRLTLTKGQHILIKAIRLLRDEGKQVRLHLVGDGPERNRLEKQTERLHLKEDVVFYGALNQEATLKVYRTSHIFALASFAEGLPVVLMEAMSMEIPCIATAINGIPEIIQNEIDGLLVAPSSMEEMKEGLSKLIDDAELRRKFGKAGRNIILEKYQLRSNIETLAKQFERRLRVCLESPIG